ncbi:MAG: oligosaccharide flippase family protein [Sphingobacteriaceae bacterium]|nr:oligosaccharide flippase family protein [Sphingobacteriaceae bacterium]
MLDRNKISAFNRNVLTLSTGSILSQALILAVSPLLSRIYSPEAFGLLAVFTGLSSFLASLSSGKYEQAILFPKSREVALNVILFCLVLSFIICSGASISLYVFSDYIRLKMNLNELFDKVFPYIPIISFIIVFYSCLQLWFQRNERYKLITIATIFQSIIVVALNLFFGFFSDDAFGLVYGYSGSIVLTALFLFVFFYFKEDIKKVYGFLNFTASIQAAIQYKKFPFTILWSELIITFSQQLMPLLLAYFYSSSIVGFYAFTTRVMKTPAIILSNSVWGVFRVEALKLKNENRSVKPLFIGVLRKTIFLGVIPFTVLSLGGSQLFKLIFGNEWVVSGVYAQIMAIFIFTEFVAHPLSNIFVIYNGQRLYLAIQGCGLIFSVIGIVLGYHFGGHKYSILLYSIFGTILNMVSIFLAFKLVKRA